MLEGLPPNNASHMLRLDCDEKRARAVADLIVETFEPTETAAAAFELDDGPRWSVEVYFATAPDEAQILALIEAAAAFQSVESASCSTAAQRASFLARLSER